MNAQTVSSSPTLAGRENSLWHELPLPAVFEILQTTEDGLGAKDHESRLQAHGPNVIETTRRHSAWRILGRQFQDFMVLLLLAAGALSAVIGDATDTAVIAGVLVVNSIIGFVQEFRAEKAVDALRRMAAPQATVVRDGAARTVETSGVVPGDVVMLRAGAVIPADLRIFRGFGLATDESALTGESAPVAKAIRPLPAATALADRSNMAYMGTTVAQGSGAGIVIATGKQTEFGRIAGLLGGEESRTPLQKRLEVFGKRVSIVALAISATVLVLGIARGEPPVLMLMTSISLAVAAVPEALPAVVTIALASGARRMVRRQALIRRLPAVETLGSVTVICSDKTGTLTMNRMTVERFYCADSVVEAPGGSAPWRDLLQAMAVSNDVTVDMEGRLVGDPTEVALAASAAGSGFDKRNIEERFPQVAEIPFESDRKRMTTFHRRPDGQFIAYTKGAPESLLPCLSPLADAARIAAAADRMAEDGLRVLAFASKLWRSLPDVLTPEATESELDFLGLTAIGDPVRPEVAGSVQTCRSAGILPVMITGDHPNTARFVARQLGMIDSNVQVLTGRELAEFSYEQVKARIGDVRVYARVDPEQKLTIVRAFQEQGHIVAMTGDGVNDAPALKRADIGVAMGVTGTDVSKEASSMILLDDNFATIVGAVREGRRIYDNLRRFVRYALTTNASELWIMFAASTFGTPIPLLPVQILWINLVTDGLPGLALAAEPADRNIMTRAPRPPKESIFAGGLGAHAIWVSILMAALALGVQFAAVRAENPHWQTMVITVIAFSQLAHVLAIRSERDSLFSQGLLSNIPLLAAVLVTAGLQLAVVYVPFLRLLFKTQPLAAAELAICIASGSVVFLAVEAEKWFKRRQDQAGSR